MKKFLFFVTFSLLLTFFVDAKTYKVEKAFLVSHHNGKEVAQGTVINDDSEIFIRGGGYLMFVDQKGKNRYYVTRCGLSTVEDLVKKTKKPKKVAKSFLENMMTSKIQDEYSSMGSVERETMGDDIGKFKMVVPIVVEPVIIEDVKVDKDGNMKVYILEDEE